MKERVCIVGSGNWGSAISKVIGENVVSNDHRFEPKVNMYVYEEMVDGEKLTDIINTTHENRKYLPGVKLPEHIIAVPDLCAAAEGATVLVFVVPHQFVKRQCEVLKGAQLAPNCRAISLIKGIDTSKGFQLVSDVIAENLGVEVSVLMGANIAGEVAAEKFCETTVGCANKSDQDMFRDLFNRPYFRVNAVDDVAPVELCGALKNVVAVGAGFVDGLELGNNTKAAVMRIGLAEIIKFIRLFDSHAKDSTFLESCGVGDLITTCFGGRNVRVATAYVRTGKPFDVLEAEMLNGQKLQGVATSEECHKVLKNKGLLHEFPLFTTIYRICYEGKAASCIISDI